MCTKYLMFFTGIQQWSLIKEFIRFIKYYKNVNEINIKQILLLKSYTISKIENHTFYTGH